MKTFFTITFLYISILYSYCQEISIHRHYRIKTIKRSTDSSSSNFNIQLIQKEKLLKDGTYKITKEVKYGYNGKILKKTLWNSHRKKTYIYYSETNSIKAKERRSYKTNIYKYKIYDTDGKVSSKGKTNLDKEYIQVLSKKGKCRRIEVK